ncbi:MAG: 2-amino-4-hydroxy-6-hydroxymethyldihydropteridine diphosphokinase [Halioglobus sp.]|nr:2-amino-4-hydroxy-6-hydroxymethyldihydropteridine diphosphokinase [Halioglobus sp.]
MTPAFVAIGSNLGEPPRQLQRAVSALATLPASALQQVSSMYRSTAIGPGEQPDYLNAVALLHTALEPDALLLALQSIEHAQGRERGERWGPRTLDLDLLLYGQQEIHSSHLTVPHPRMHERDFVLYPLREISNTSLVLPGGKDIDYLLEQLPPGELEKLPDPLRVQ